MACQYRRDFASSQVAKRIGSEQNRAQNCRAIIEGEMPRKKRPQPDLPPGPARDLVDLFAWLRGSRPMRVGQIANRTGYAPGHVSEVLRGWKAPSPDAAARIAQVLGADDISSAHLPPLPRPGDRGNAVRSMSAVGRTAVPPSQPCAARREFASEQRRTQRWPVSTDEISPLLRWRKKLAASKTASRTAAPLSGVRCRVKNGPSLTCHRVPPATWWTCSRGSVVPGRCVSGRSRTGPVTRPRMSARYCADGRRPAPTPPPGSRKRSARTI